MEIEFKRNCPECEKELKYSCKSSLTLAQKRNTSCHECSALKGDSHPLHRIGPNKGRNFSEEHKRKLSESHKGKKLSEEQKKKLVKLIKERKYQKKQN